MRECREIAASDPARVSYSEIGKSEEGRPIPLLTITDPAIPARDKSVFLLSGGTDGNEEVGRAVALGMARALLAPERRALLYRQVVLVVPVTNPDGCARNQPDRAGNARGIPAAGAYPDDGPPVTSEARAMRALVDEWLPDAHVDFHGLAGGSMGDCEFLYPTVNSKWSIPVLMDIVREIENAGALAGFPQQGRPRLWMEPRHNLPGWMAKHLSAVCMVIEGTENYYPIEESVRSGVVRLLRFMAFGDSTDRYFQDFPNYPCDVVSGGFMAALMPLGATYEERRRCRRDISEMIVQGVPVFERLACDRDWTAVIYLPVEDSVRTFPKGMRFKATLHRSAVVKDVMWHDRRLEPALWRQAITPAGIVVTADVPEPPRRGANYLKIRYEVPFKRHVEPGPAEET
jgi:hypothetical protein